MNDWGKNGIIIKMSLIISVVVVIPAALIYGFNPALLLDIEFSTTDEANFTKGVMGLYLSFALFWAIALFRNNIIHAALITNAVFMIGLGLGRVVSLYIDGLPSNPYLIGLCGELLLGSYSLWVLYTKKPQRNL